MGKIRDIVGERFGRLVVIERAPPNPKHKARKSRWVCQCDCGQTKEVLGEHLVAGYTKSCGCFRELDSHARFYRGCGDLSGKYWGHVQRHAKNREFEFDISIEEAWRLFEYQDKKCALSHLPITLNSNWSKLGQTASLDRIDSERGYVKDNVQWVHVDVQRMKMNLPEDRFVFLCEEIAKSRRSRCESSSQVVELR